MSIVSIDFLIFISIVIFVFFIVPKRAQWIVLLVSSYCFYLFAGITPLVFVFLTTVVVYLGGRLMSSLALASETRKAAKKKMKKVLAAVILLVFSTLFLIKYLNFVVEAASGLFGLFKYDAGNPLMNIMLPMGISFYMFQAIGYCIDIYRGKISAEKNFFRFALFISFFPQAVQGPISRYGDLGEQLSMYHAFSYKNLCFGAQLILWGFVKKLIIADRIAIPVNAVFDNYGDYNGTQILIAIILYAIQIYADFSGGIDIVRGTAECMDIKLVENFQRPYFGNSVAEYWRRWHISLTSWMRDYVFYSLALSKMSNKIGKWGRVHIVKGNIGKQLPSYLPTFVTFFLIGIWHGAGWGFIVFGLYNATIIVGSMALSGLFESINGKLHINTDCFIWKGWQIIRTFAIMVVGKCITRAISVSAGISMLKYSLTFSPVNIVSDLQNMGMDLDNWFVLVLALVLFFLVSVMQEKGWNVREKIASLWLPLRWAIYMAGVLAVIVVGIYGVGYDASAFIYRGF